MWGPPWQIVAGQGPYRDRPRPARAWGFVPITRIPAFTKKNQGRSTFARRPWIATQGPRRQIFWSHMDIGNMGRLCVWLLNIRSGSRAWVVIDAPLPGIGDWDNITRKPDAVALQFSGGS